jgi:hypothetical protein
MRLSKVRRYGGDEFNEAFTAKLNQAAAFLCHVITVIVGRGCWKDQN